MIISVSKAQLLKGIPINPGWYKCECIEFPPAKKPSTGGDSLNYVPKFKLETANEEEIDLVFNSKAMVGWGAFVAAVQGRTLKEVMDDLGEDRLNFDTDDAVGKKMQIKIINEPYQGRLVNKIDVNNNGFLPYDAATPF